MRKEYCLLLPILALLLLAIFPVNLHGQEEIVVPEEQTFFWTKPTTYKWTMMNPFAPGTPQVTWLSYEYLVIQDDVSLIYGFPNYGMRPILAKEWGWVDDVTFEIKLRTIAYFWSGRPVTADDVIFSIWLEMRPEIPGPLASIAGMVEDLVKIDDYTLHIKLRPEYAKNKMVYWILTGAFVLPKYQWEELWNTYGKDIVKYNLMEHLDEMDASGPYKPLALKESAAYFKRVENYWGEQLGWLFAPEYYVNLGDYTSDMMFRLIGEHKRDMCSLTAEISLEWQRARIDYLGAWNMEGEAWEVHGLHGGSCKAVFFNFEKDPVFRELWFREALTYAIDPYKVVDAATFGQGLPANHIFLYPASYWDYIQMSKSVLEEHFDYVVDTPDGPRLGYNPDLAIQILEEHCDPGSSVENGWYYQGRKLGGWGIIYVADWRSWASAVEVIVKFWKDIGIEVTPVPLEWPAYFDASTSGNWEIAFSWHPGGTYPPTGIEMCFQNAYAATIWPQAPYTVSLCGFQRFWNGSYPPLPALADEVRELTAQLWTLEFASEEYNQTYMRLLELVLPQLPMIPIFNEACEKTWNRADRWVNWPTVDDPYDYRIQDCGTLPCSWNPLRRLYPAKVDTVSFTLSKYEAEVGETVTAYVTLRNRGEYEQRYKVVINLGPAKAGWELTEEGIVAWKIVKVPPGETTVELPIKFDEAGSYVLVVDNWRIGKYDPGDPMEVVLTVKAPPITYVTVYATEDIGAFTGADGKTYGPYSAGDAMIIPKADADRLMAEGKASASPPVPPEIPAIADAVSELITKADDIASSISDLKTAVDNLAGLSTTMSELADSVEALSGQVEALSGQIATLTTITLGIGVVTIILVVITAALVVRKK
mgnify:CR=1 FL=1